MNAFECKNSAGSMCSLKILICIFIIPLFSSIAFANDIGGSLSGEIQDPTGAAIAKAKVTLTNPGTGVTLTTVSNNTGSYYFASVPVGTYELRVFAPGFRAYRRTAITMNVTSIVRADAALEMGEKQETVSQHTDG
jgi:hypothetical protein